MNFILDIFFILLYILIVLVATDKGLVKSIWRTLTIVGAFILAYLFGPAIGEWIYDNFMLDYVSSYAKGIVSDLIEKSADQYEVSELFDELPQEFLNLLSNCGADLNELCAEFGPSVTVSESELILMSQRIAQPISITLSNAVGIILVFILSVILLTVLGLVLRLFVKLPIIHSIDSLFGFVFGLAEGFVIVWILCLVLGVLVEKGFMSGPSNEVLYSLTDSSLIFKYFCELSPIDFININIE